MWPYETTEQDEIIQKINFDATQTLSNKQITKNILDQWRNSKPIKDMIQGWKYYRVENTSIDEKTRDYYDPNTGRRIENKSASNVKLKSAYIRDSITQKINYAFNNNFILEVSSKEDNGNGDDSELAKYRKEWQNFLSEENRETLTNTATEAVIKGIGWLYIYIDNQGDLQITDIDSETIYPAWQDNKQHKKLDAVVRDYRVLEYNIDTPVEIQKVEYWDKETKEFFIDQKGDLVPDIEAEHYINGELKELPESDIQSHMLNGEKGISWGKVPFIALKGNSDELPLLNVVRSYIDAFDELASKSVDTIKDDIDPILVFKNISPEIGGLVAARQLLQSARIASVDENGGAEYLTVNTDISAVEQKLNFLESKIIKFSNTADLNTITVGTSSSEVSIKAMYSNLDIYCNGIENQFRSTMNNLKYFFDMWLQFRNIGTMEKWNDYKLMVTLDRDILINESQLISDTKNLVGIVSQETLDNFNPAVLDHETEQVRRDKEDEAQTKKDEAEMGKIQIIRDQERLLDNQNNE
jgi:SPP1 family phage portal protein